MTAQPTHNPTPLDSLDADRAALLTEWMQAVATQQPTGDCEQPSCGGKLRPLPANITPGVIWLEAECDRDPRHTVALPNGHRKVTAARRPGPLAQVHQVALRSSGTGSSGDRVPDWRERAVGGDY
jgi:hypothetical protein